MPTLRQKFVARYQELNDRRAELSAELASIDKEVAEINKQLTETAPDILDSDETSRLNRYLENQGFLPPSK